MDLINLKWTKNVNNQDGIPFWRYQPDGTSRIFVLGWKKTSRKNARNPRENELIILRQHARVTHIVKIFNDTLYDDGSGSDFHISRLIQIVWMPTNLEHLPTNQEVFGEDFMFPRSGNVINLQHIKKFNNYWSLHGGLAEFSHHVQGVLNNYGKWQEPLIALDKCAS